MFRQRNWKSKYGNTRSSFQGIIYHSKAEAGFAEELELRRKANDILSWERQIPIELRVNDRLICKYYCDFLIHHKGGEKELVEVKGMETEVYRLKRKLLEATFLFNHPEYTYTVIKV